MEGKEVNFCGLISTLSGHIMSELEKDGLWLNSNLKRYMIIILRSEFHRLPNDLGEYVKLLFDANEIKKDSRLIYDMYLPLDKHQYLIFELLIRMTKDSVLLPDDHPAKKYILNIGAHKAVEDAKKLATVPEGLVKK